MRKNQKYSISTTVKGTLEIRGHFTLYGGHLYLVLSALIGLTITLKRITLNLFLGTQVKSSLTVSTDLHLQKDKTFL